jgi:hypothetical protein
MTERQEPYGVTAECLHCGVTFVPRRAGHVFHSAFCRHRGERAPHERKPVDLEPIVRLFDEARDPGEKVRPDDWHPAAELGTAAEWRALDAGQSVTQRRRWYGTLVLEGRL